jgi:hypothetical protein
MAGYCLWYRVRMFSLTHAFGAWVLYQFWYYSVALSRLRSFCSLLAPLSAVAVDAVLRRKPMTAAERSPFWSTRSTFCPAGHSRGGLSTKIHLTGRGDVGINRCGVPFRHKLARGEPKIRSGVRQHNTKETP